MINESDRPTFECEEIYPLLSEYVDAELPVDMCSRVAAHVQACESCAAFIESLKASIALCRNLECELVPAPLPDSVKLHLREMYEATLRSSLRNDNNRE